MKKLKLLILGILSIIGLSSFSFADFTENGITYQDGFYWSSGRQLITYITGNIVWTLMDKNIGATEVYDGTPTSYGTLSNYNSPCSQLGYFYQFGNYHQFDCTTVLSNLNSISTVDWDGTTVYNWNTNLLNSSSFLLAYPTDFLNFASDAWGGVTHTAESMENMCPDGFSIPLFSDWLDFIASFMGRSSYPINGSSFYDQDSSDSFTKSLFYYLKLPILGSTYNAYTFNVSSYFWSSDLLFYNNLFWRVPNFTSYQYSSSTYRFGFYASSIEFNPYLTYPGDGNAAYRRIPIAPVRCMKNDVVLPDNTWVSLTGGTTENLPDPEPENPGGGDGTGDSSLVPVYSNFEDPNVQILESAIWCYMTSGLYYDGTYQTGGCDWGYSSLIDSFGLVSGSVYWSESLKYGNISFSPSSNVLNYYCLSPYASYSFCDNLDLYNNTYIVYSVMSEGSGPDRLMYNIFGSGVSISIDNLGSGHLSGLNCNGVWCDNYNVSVPEYVYTGVVSDSGVVINDYLGYYIDTGYYNVLNGNRFFFNCPYSYSGNYFNFDNKIIDWLGGTKLGNVIGCPITAFVYGRRQLLFKDFESGNEYRDGYLFGNLSSSQAKAMYTFFDIILSLIILVLFQKLYHLIFK